MYETKISFCVNAVTRHKRHVLCAVTMTNNAIARLFECVSEPGCCPVVVGSAKSGDAAPLGPEVFPLS